MPKQNRRPKPKAQIAETFTVLSACLRGKAFRRVPSPEPSSNVVANGVFHCRIRYIIPHPTVKKNLASQIPLARRYTLSPYTS